MRGDWVVTSQSRALHPMFVPLIGSHGDQPAIVRFEDRRPNCAFITAQRRHADLPTFVIQMEQPGQAATAATKPETADREPSAVRADCDASGNVSGVGSRAGRV